MQCCPLAESSAAELNRGRVKSVAAGQIRGRICQIFHKGPEAVYSVCCRLYHSLKKVTKTGMLIGFDTEIFKGFLRDFYGLWQYFDT